HVLSPSFHLYPSLSRPSYCPRSFFFTAPAPPDLYTLSLHDALPISPTWRTCSSLKSSCVASSHSSLAPTCDPKDPTTGTTASARSEEHTSELQSQSNLVCRLLLEKKKKTQTRQHAQATQPDSQHSSH